jgi:hypothetical protein
MDNSQLSEKTLPASVCRSYVNAHFLRRGYGQATFFTYRAVWDLSKNKVDVEAWKDLVHLYMKEDNSNELPLISYSLNACFFMGLVKNLTDLEERRLTSQQIGNLWWWGETPLSALSVLYPSMLELIGRPAEQHLIAFKKAELALSKQAAEINRTLRYQALLFIMHEFATQTQIPHTLMQDDRRFVIVISECPCCLSFAEGCEFFIGLFEAILSWLQGTYRVKKHKEYLILNTTESTGHRIVIDYSG